MDEAGQYSPSGSSGSVRVSLIEPHLPVHVLCLRHRLCTTEDLTLVIALLTFIGASLWLLTTTLQLLWAICGRLLKPFQLIPLSHTHSLTFPCQSSVAMFHSAGANAWGAVMGSGLRHLTCKGNYGECGSTDPGLPVYRGLVLANL